MAYEKQTWANNQSGGTPLSADRLNHIEEGLEDHDTNELIHSSGIEIGYVENITGTKLSLGTTWTSPIDQMVIVIEPSERPVWVEGAFFFDATAVPGTVGTASSVQGLICTDSSNALATMITYSSVIVSSPTSATGVNPGMLFMRGRLGPTVTQKTIYMLAAKNNVSGYNFEVLNGNASSAWKTWMAAVQR